MNPPVRSQKSLTPQPVGVHEPIITAMAPVPMSLGHVVGMKFRRRIGYSFAMRPELAFPVVGTGVDPVTSRFSGARSTN